MSPDIQAAWQAVIHHPLFGIGLTLATYQLALAVYERTRWPIFQPVLLAMLMVIGILHLFAIDVREYLNFTGIFVLLLGPVIVALAVPLYINLRHIRQLLKPVLQTLLIAGLIATLMGSGLAWLFGASEEMQRTLLTKSVTSPFSILLADKVHGIPALAAIFSILTGVIGAIVGPSLLQRINVRHPAAIGMAMGLTSHAVGTARALQEGEQCGGFAALGMSLIGVATAVLLPVAVSLIA
ncbi:TIGR00659 family protein [Pseudomonas pohangensis]|jgi:predicted murein hydrolase (TIGR00659 family)|uniref:TIGR00659 family protein n=1 Tax=Pseudomonas pohangensis TaxID=364197 RepID=A0A1H2H9E6_9PSED|nr:LrgB family protein [Pseudomonas pohangensis]SDU28455.1 TIGR00659 family protein [Pseudomonas pohangensis]